MKNRKGEKLGNGSKGESSNKSQSNDLLLTSKETTLKLRSLYIKTFDCKKSTFEIRKKYLKRRNFGGKKFWREEILVNLANWRKNSPNSPKFLPAKINFILHSPKLILANLIFFLHSPKLIPAKFEFFLYSPIFFYLFKSRK